MNLPNPIFSASVSRPEHIVVRDAEVHLTAQALFEAVRLRAARLAKWGVCPGDIIGLWGAWDHQFVINLHALGWLGATAAPLPVAAPNAEWLRHLDAVGAKRVVVGSGADAQVRAGLVAALRGAEALFDGAHAADGVDTSAQDNSLVPERFWPADEPRLVVLSSGTQSAPHPVALTGAQLFFSAVGSASRLGHHVDDTWLLCLPLHHVGGLSILFRAAFFGVTVEMMPRFDPSAVALSLASGEVSLVSMVPQMLTRVLDAVARADMMSQAKWAPSPRLRAILLGGAPAPQSLLARCQALGLPVCVTWGMTEAASQIATSWPGSYLGAGDCGPPLPFARVGPAHAAGPLVVTGPVVGHKAITTKDWGHITAAGRVVVQGRCDDILISGGENIAPFEIESVLLMHPLIADAAVVGIEDSTWGQRPVAILVGQADRPSDAALVAWCRDSLASFKVPAQFIWCRSLPRDALGKLRRAQLLTSVHEGVENV